VTNILLVDDETLITDSLSYSLQREGFTVKAVTHGKQALEAIDEFHPDLIVLDLMLPDQDGFRVLRTMKQRGLDMPVLILTARGEEADRVRGLENGADDYVVKPFSLRELKARINAHLRKQVSARATTFSINGLELDQESYRTTVNGELIELGPTEFRLLRHFMSHLDRVFTRSQLLDTVWGANVYIEERTVDVHIRRLRKALEPFDKQHFIQTVRGAGYRFSARR